MTTTATYYVGQDAPSLDIYWSQNGELIDFSDAGWMFFLTVYPRGGTAVFTKSTGITGVLPVDEETPIDFETPNVTVAWTNELDNIAPGRYVLEISASDSGGPSLLFFGELIIRAPGPAWGYCEVVDLLLGDLKVSSAIDQQAFINSAADEINARLGRVYALPIDIHDPEVEEWVGLTLKTINAQLAAGRLIRAQSRAAEVVKYADELIKEAMTNLAALCGEDLSGVERNERDKVTAPAIVNQDLFSGVDGYENFAHRDHRLEWWHPGGELGPRVQ